jgi:hypothetical protein
LELMELIVSLYDVPWMGVGVLLIALACLLAAAGSFLRPLTEAWF